MKINIEEFLKWISNNPYEFQKMFPKMDADLRKTAKKMDIQNPFQSANLIDLIVDDFSNMIEEANKMIGNRKKEEYRRMKRIFENLLSYDMEDNILVKISRDRNKQNFLGYIKYIDEKLINIDKKQNINLSQRGFDLGLTEPQLKVLHQRLINDNFIKCTDTDFINAFSGRQIVNKLEWIDKAERVKYVTIQTLFQLLHSCNIELLDKNKVIKKEVKDALNSIFSNLWGNITSKFNEFNPLTTNRQKTISSMINNLKS